MIRAWLLFLLLAIPCLSSARAVSLEWNAGANWPSGTTVELCGNGDVCQPGLTGTTATLDLPVVQGDVIQAKARAVPPQGYQCGTPLAVCPPSEWTTLSQTLPPLPSGFWANRKSRTMAAPTYVNQYATAFNTTTTPKTAMSAVAISSGDVLVAVAACEATQTISLTENGAASATLQQSRTASGYAAIIGWTYVAPANETITVSFSGGAGNYFGGNVIRFSSSSGVGASNLAYAASGNPSVSLTTTQDNSAIVVIVTDYNAKSGAQTFTNNFSGTPSALTDYPGDGSTYGVAIAYFPDAGTAGSKTVGMSAPTGQKWMIIAIEVKGTAGGDVTLSPAEMTHAQAIDAAALVQDHLLSPAEVANAQAIDGTTLLQQSVLSPSDLLNSQTIDATALIQAHTLAIADITHAQTLDNVALVVAGNIAPADMMTAQVMDAPLLLQAHLLTPAEVANAQAIDGATLIQSSVIVPAGMDHAVILDSPALVQAHVISPTDARNTQAMDNATLSVFGSLSVADLLNSQAMDSAGLVQAHLLSPADLLNSQTIDALTLLQGFILVPADLLQANRLDGSLLDLRFGLTPTDLLHAQAMDSAGLIQAHVLFAADMLQANRFDVAGVSSGLLTVPTGRAIVIGESDRYVLLSPSDRFILLTPSTRVVI